LNLTVQGCISNGIPGSSLCMTYKTSLRKEKIQERNSISKKEIALAEKNTATHFINIFGELNFEKVSIYFPINNEVPTETITRYIRELGKKCYLPLIDKDLNNKEMEFSEFTSEVSLAKNKFNVPEPLNGSLTIASELELVIMPLVAFDNKGYRLGMGKGYYDFTFKNFELTKGKIFLGLAYDFQKTESCYPEEHDLKMDAVICPSGVYKFS